MPSGIARTALVVLTVVFRPCPAGNPAGPITAPGPQQAALPLGALARLTPLPDNEAASLLSLALAPDGKTLATGDRRGMLTIWDITSGKPRASFPTHLGPVWSLAFSPDGR